MTVVGDGPDYEQYMQQWMRDHPNKHWHRCPTCRNWRLASDPKGHCPLCKPKNHKRSQT